MWEESVAVFKSQFTFSQKSRACCQGQYILRAWKIKDWKGLCGNGIARGLLLRRRQGCETSDYLFLFFNLLFSRRNEGFLLSSNSIEFKALFTDKAWSSS